MLSEKQRGILRDIMHQIDLAERFIENHDLESFERDELHLYAVTRCLEIISEVLAPLTGRILRRAIPLLSGSKWPVLATSTVMIIKELAPCAYGMR